MKTQSFTAKLEPVPHGGLFVVVPAAVAASAGLAHGDRVCGTADGAPYRSSLMKYSGVFHLGLHKETLGKAGVGLGDRVEVTIRRDDAPLPTDVVPRELGRALASVAKAKASWNALAPAVRRGFVKSVLEAKRAETRARRIEQIVETLREGVPKRRTWKPPDR